MGAGRWWNTGRDRNRPMIDLEDGIAEIFEEAGELGSHEFVDRSRFLFLRRRKGRPEKLSADELRRRERIRQSAYRKRIDVELKAKRYTTPGWEEIERTAKEHAQFKKGEWYAPDGSRQGEQAAQGVGIAGEGGGGE
jgi:hypothetical protein